MAILSRNNPQWMMAFIGATSVGAVAVPMNAWWTTEELDYGFADSGANIVVADRDRVERLAPIAEKHGLQIITIDDCSGLGVEHTPFAELLEALRGAGMPRSMWPSKTMPRLCTPRVPPGIPRARFRPTGVFFRPCTAGCDGGCHQDSRSGRRREGRLPPAALVTIPLFHCTGSHSAFMLSLIVGRKMVIMHKWDAQEALRLIEEERITWFNGVPTMSAELQAAAATTTGMSPR